MNFGVQWKNTSYIIIIMFYWSNSINIYIQYYKIITEIGYINYLSLQIYGCTVLN